MKHPAQIQPWNKRRTDASGKPSMDNQERMKAEIAELRAALAAAYKMAGAAIAKATGAAA